LSFEMDLAFGGRPSRGSEGGPCQLRQTGIVNLSRRGEPSASRFKGQGKSPELKKKRPPFANGGRKRSSEGGAIQRFGGREGLEYRREKRDTFRDGEGARAWKKRNRLPILREKGVNRLQEKKKKKRGYCFGERELVLPFLGRHQPSALGGGRAENEVRREHFLRGSVELLGAARRERGSRVQCSEGKKKGLLKKMFQGRQDGSPERKECGERGMGKPPSQALEVGPDLVRQGKKDW